MRYNYICDIGVFMVSLMMLMLLKATYIPKSNRLLMLKCGLYNLMYCCILSIALNHYLLPNLSQANKYTVYLFHNALQISYVTELGLFIFYMYNLISFHSKVANIAVIGLSGVFYLLELTSVFTHIGFWIDDDLVIHQQGITNIYFIWYIMFTAIFVTTIVLKNKVLITRIYYALFSVYAFCITITISQYFYNTESFTSLTYLLPMIVVAFLFHSNSYNSSFGALDKAALRGRLKDLQHSKTPFSFVYFQIPNFSSIEFNQKTAKDFNAFTKAVNYKDYLFRYDDDIFIMLFNKATNFDLIKDSFAEMHSDYKMSHKILVIDSNDICKSLNDYMGLCKSVLNKVSYPFYKVAESDLNRYSKSIIIKHELADIELKHDLNDPRVKVYCQPILNIEKKIFTTAESLMRLELDDLGLVYPDMFIPIAESEGRIHILTLIILNKVCQFIESHPDITRISVNFSMYEITKPNFYEDILGVVSKYNIDLSKLGFEVTESIEAEDFDIIYKILAQFRKLGIKIYLDDFGTGYSNLEHITKLPLDIIKFDRSLVVSSGQSDMTEYMVKSMSSMFNIIGYSILYEGIEDESDQKRCISMKAEYLQGYRYSKPIPISDLDKFINKPFTEDIL